MSEIPNPPVFPDGRTGIRELFRSYRKFVEAGWQLDIITTQGINVGGVSYTFPVIGLRSPNPNNSKAIWALAGTHGEEPAPVMAISQSANYLVDLAKKIPVVVLPIQNFGYVLDWRYFNEIRDFTVGLSVSDMSHLLPDPNLQEFPHGPWSEKPSSPHAAKIAAYLVNVARTTHPPKLVVAHHEDEKLANGYLYALGMMSQALPVANQMINTLNNAGTPIQHSGFTRFGEPIVNGIVSAKDGSPEHLVTSAIIYWGGVWEAGLGATAAYTVETPTIGLSLTDRVAAHRAIINSLPNLFESIS